MKLDQSYWDERYQKGETGWDIGTVSAPLQQYIDQLRNKQLSILIPGCGNAYEAEYLLMKGFSNITLVDISPAAVSKMQERLKNFEGKSLRIICGDFFKLHEEFDLIIEQTFFCALSPALRAAYVSKMHELLKEDGKLAGLLFNRSFEGGPPFGGNKEEYVKLFSTLFEIIVMEPCYNSIAPRAGGELFFILKKR